MDDVETVRDLPTYFPELRSTFVVHTDPVYDRFRNGKKVYKGEALILTVSVYIELFVKFYVDKHRTASGGLKNDITCICSATVRM
jgi:hypothetical protein